MEYLHTESNFHGECDSSNHTYILEVEGNVNWTQLSGSNCNVLYIPVFYPYDKVSIGLVNVTHG